MFIHEWHVVCTQLKSKIQTKNRYDVVSQSCLVSSARFCGLKKETDTGMKFQNA